MLAALFALAGDDRRAREHVARPHLLREPHLEPADRLGAEPVLHDARREAHRQHAVAEHRRVPDLGRDRVVVVHRVEVARRARVLHEHRAGERRELLRAARRRPTTASYVDHARCCTDGLATTPSTRRVIVALKVTRASHPPTLRRWPAACATAGGALAARPQPPAPARQPTATGGAPAQTRELRARGQRTLRKLLDAGVEVFATRGLPRGTRRRHRQARARRRTAPSTCTSRTRKTCSARSMAEVADEMQALAEDLGPLAPGAGGPRRAAGVDRAVRRPLRAVRAGDPRLDRGRDRQRRVRPARHRRAHPVHARAHRAHRGRRLRPTSIPVDRRARASSRCSNGSTTTCCRDRCASSRTQMVDTLARVTHAALFGT